MQNIPTGRTATLPFVPESSALAGLRRRSLGPVEVTAQSVAVTAPSAAMASTPALVAASAGTATVFAYAIAFLLVMLVCSCINEFCRRLVSTGSLYSFTAQGLGTASSTCVAGALIIGYGLLSMTTLLLSTSYLLDLAHGAGLGYAPSRWLVALVMIVLGVGATALMVRGVALSSRVALAIEGASIVAIGVALTVLWLRGGTHLDAALLRLNGASPHGLGTGVALAITSFVGFESAAALGVETSRPHRNVPRALIVTALGAGVLYVVGVYVLLAAPHATSGSAGQLSNSGAQHSPLAQIAFHVGGGLLSHLVDVGIAASGFGCAMASTTALARLMFTMARERVLPASFGRTHPRFGTPARAIVVSMVAIVGLPVVLVLCGFTPWRVFSDLLTISTFGYVLAYLLVCLATPLFLRRIGELTSRPLISAAIAVIGLALVLSSYVYPATSVSDRALFGVFAIALAVIVLWLRQVLRRDGGRVGAYDEAVISDLFDPDAFRGSGRGPSP